jgi:predicted acylesterase/phospholipase RssA
MTAMPDPAQQIANHLAQPHPVGAQRGPTAAPPPRGALIGVALSGGGLRAALFSLGVLIGLVHCGENRKVSHIASVSGGSITSAAVAQSCAYGDCPGIEDFRTISGPLATMLAKNGVLAFSWSATLGFLKSITSRLPLVAGLIAQVAFFGAVLFNIFAARQAALLKSLHPREWPWVWVIVIAAALVLAGLMMARGALQEASYSATLASMSGGKSGLKLGELTDSSTTHVFVATDLVSGDPVYFGRDFVACPALGWGTPDGLGVATAVYASAAFPFVFPARRLPCKKFRFQGGDAAPPFPRALRLTDGGVHNNLGTDWFNELRAQDRQQVWKFGNVHYPRRFQVAQEQIVVNAGAASSGLKRVWPLLSVRRTMSILYDNTVQPRLELLRDSRVEESGSTIVLDIAESPFHLAERYLKNCQGAEQQARARTIADKLETRGEAFWLGFARQTSATKTKLTRAGLESGARMIMHGYLSTIVAMHVIRGVPLPDRVCDEGYFLDLCGRRPRDTQSRSWLGRLVHHPGGRDDSSEETDSVDLDLTPAGLAAAVSLDPVSGRAGP